MSLLLPLSIWWLRVRHYDLFLITHIALALVTLVCLFYHTKIFDGEFDGFLWPCVAFWSFDRACRIGRVVYFAVRGNFSRGMVHYSPEEDIMRVDISSVLRKTKTAGGVHFFL